MCTTTAIPRLVGHIKAQGDDIDSGYEAIHKSIVDPVARNIWMPYLGEFEKHR